MAKGFSITIEATQLRNALGQFQNFRNTGVVGRALLRMALVGREALRIAQKAAPKASGKFSAGLTVEGYGEMGFAIVTDNPELLLWLRKGTGIYAGSGYITPRQSPVMAFPEERWRNAPIPSNGGTYFFRRIRGMRANPWESQALDEILAMAHVQLMQVVADYHADLGIGELR